MKIVVAVTDQGGNMANLSNALQELRAERSRAQSQVEKVEQAISVIESLNGAGTSGKTTAQSRVISAASRRKMALAQQARWAKMRKESKPARAGTPKPTGSAPGKPKHTMSAAARKRIAAAQKARWAKIKAGQKKAA
jgi:dsDNA-specific endonuclease/ATPase MutS2